MKIIFYPEGLNDKESRIKEQIESLKKDHFKRYTQIQNIFSLIEKNDFKVLKDLEKRGIYKPLGEGMHEFDIPPHGKGGVVRIYFTFHKERKDTIVILDMELKKKNKADIETAKERKKEYD
ncbi:MAG: hypothetical protein ACP5SP_08060 [Caldisericum sp.]|uniref:hypothetical protein n=1 Tax=Caldisericum sp. TaxID=2499687 RepID=UPI003D13EBA7